VFEKDLFIIKISYSLFNNCFPKQLPRKPDAPVNRIFFFHNFYNIVLILIFKNIYDYSISKFLYIFNPHDSSYHTEGTSIPRFVIIFILRTLSTL
jgi:hypothetical protein